ncbi:MAG TPA: ROK family protein [Candidatus Dormibacteraeota bacterium]|nr:ROK family protein [Candidatus Dormibacteraeota bacterium]
MSTLRNRGNLVVGADIGGTKTAILVCEPDGTVRARTMAPTAIGNPDRAAASITSMVEAALRDAGANPDDVAALGIGVPGRVDRERGHVTLAVNLDWHDLPLRPRLEAALGIPTFLENDVRAAALGLHRRRLFGPVESLAFLAIGTGISAGVVLDGVLHRGANGLAGEIGHAIIDPNGTRCACGNTGCFETVAAGPALVSRTLAGWAARRNGHVDAAADATAAVRETGAEAVYAAAAAGDPVARDVVDSTGRAIAWGIHLLALAYDVERIVVGGGVSHAGDAFMTPVERELGRYRASSPLAAEILLPDLVQLLPAGSDAGAWGAVTIAREALGFGVESPVLARRSDLHEGG